VLEQSVLIVGQRIWLPLVKLIIQNEPFFTGEQASRKCLRTTCTV